MDKIILQYLNGFRDQNIDIWSNLCKNKIEYMLLKNHEEQLFNAGITDLTKKKNKYRILEDKFKKTLELLDKFNDDVDFVLLKTWVGYEYINSDIDILVCDMRSLQLLQKFLSKNNYYQLTAQKFKFWDPYNEKHKEIWKHNSNELQLIHIHKNIAWGSVIYLDKNKVFKNSINKKIFGIYFKVPDDVGDFLVLSAHILFENHKITLGDFFHMIALNKYLDKSKIEEYSNNYKWVEKTDIILHYFDFINNNFNNNIFFQIPIELPKSLLTYAMISKIFADFNSGDHRSAFYDIETYSLDIFRLFFIKPIRSSR